MDRNEKKSIFFSRLSGRNETGGPTVATGAQALVAVYAKTLIIAEGIVAKVYITISAGKSWCTCARPIDSISIISASCSILTNTCHRAEWCGLGCAIRPAKVGQT